MGNVFNSPSIELTKVMLKLYGVDLEACSGFFEPLGLPMDAEELPGVWSLYRLLLHAMNV